MASTLYTTAVDLRSEQIRLVWRVTGWRLSRQFHRSAERPLSSSEFETANCKWRMELRFGFPDDDGGDLAQTIQAGLHLVDCDATPSSIVVEGELRIDSISNQTYVKKKLTGNLSVGEARLCAPQQANAFSDSLQVVAELKVLVGRGMAFHRTEAGGVSETAADAERQSAQLREALASLIDDPGHYDLTVTVGESEFHGHRAIFAARSPKFREMFASRRGRGRPRPEDELEVSDCSPEEWQIFHEFIYTGTTSQPLAENLDVCSTLLRLGKEYEVESLRESVVASLEAALDKENLFEVMEIAFRFQLERLQEATLQFLRLNMNYFKAEQKSMLLRCTESRADLAAIVLDCL